MLYAFTTTKSLPLFWYRSNHIPKNYLASIYSHCEISYISFRIVLFTLNTYHDCTLSVHNSSYEEIVFLLTFQSMIITLEISLIIWVLMLWCIAFIPSVHVHFHHSYLYSDNDLHHSPLPILESIHIDFHLFYRSVSIRCMTTSRPFPHFIWDYRRDYQWHILFMWDVIIHACPNFHRDLSKPSFKFSFYPRPVLAFDYCRCLRLSVCPPVRPSVR